MVEISEVDVHDDGLLREYWDVEQAAQRADRTHPVLRSYDRLVQLARQPAPGHHRTLLAAYDGPGLVGVAELSGSTADNLHLAEVEVDVLPSHRRRGIGRALLAEVLRRGRAEGRRTFIGEACRPTSEQPSDAISFAQASGFEPAHREDHLVLDLPASPAAVAGSTDSGHTILTWANRVPDDLVTAYARMRTQMNHDVPIGDLDREPAAVTVEQIRAGEDRLSHHYDTVVGVARRPDGELGGYTLAFLPHGEDYVQQDDTFVAREARGQGVGRSLKTAVLRMLAAERPERARVHTWTDPDNDPMQRLNRALGFRPVELMLEMQLKPAWTASPPSRRPWDGSRRS
jgi:GNAT superfamily N-acetyltransferase